MVIAFALVFALASASTSAPSQGKEEFEKGTELFRAERFEDALPYFERAYTLSKKRAPTILALAQCERALKRYADAIVHYNEYLLTKPRPKDADEVLGTVRLLEKLRREEGAGTPEIAERSPESRTQPEEPRETRPSSTTTVAASSAETAHEKTEVASAATKEETPPVGQPANVQPNAAGSDPRIVAPVEAKVEEKGPSMLKIGVISAGGVAVVTGAVFAILAASQKSHVSDLITQRADPSTVSDAADQGFFRAVLADVFVGVGAIAALIGLFMVE